MSTTLTPIHRLHQHRAWVNQNLLSAAAELTAEQVRQEFPIGQGSIWKSLLHMYAAEYVWLEALLGNESAIVKGDLPGRLPGNQLGAGGFTSFDELRQAWTDLQSRWDNYLSTLAPDSLDDPVAKIASSTGQRFTTRRLDVLLHVCTHAHYTAAQVINMLRHTSRKENGAQKLPDTMLITLARRESE